MPVPLDGDVDVAALGAALSAITARHEVLRTRLVADADGVPHQVIDPPAPFPLPVADVSSAPQPLAAARALVAADLMTPFDLATGPLIRGCLIRLSAAEHVLALTAHHIVFDEWSRPIFRRELSALYAALLAGEGDPLPPLAVQYADFAVWQREWLSGALLEGQLAYWRDQLAGTQTLELPADRPRPPVRSTTGAVTEFAVSARTTAALRAVARESDATMFMIVHAALAMLLGRYCGTDDVVVGTPIANRTRAETEDLIGFFVNTLVLRVDLSGDPEFTGLLARARRVALDAYAHQDVPFEQLVDELVAARDRSRTPLFQVFFNYVPASTASEYNASTETDTGTSTGTETGTGTGTKAESENHPVKFDITFRLSEIGDGLAGALHYSTELFNAERIERVVRHLVATLEAVAVGAQRPISQLQMLSPGEQAQLAGWNDTAMPPSPAGGVHELIAARAAGSPAAIAVESDGVCLTYEALEERANQLAHYLQSVGVRAETVVGLCLDPGPDMIVAVLAVWKAGGAYLSLGPHLPLERLSFMLSDSGAAVLISRGEIAQRLSARHKVALDHPDVRAELAAAPTGTPHVATSPDQLACTIYTSGTMGTPKGVQITHRSMMNYTECWAANYPGIKGTTLLYAPLVLDAACSALACGGRVHAAPLNKELLLARKVAGGGTYTFLKITPGMLASLPDLPDECAPAGELMIGGDSWYGWDVQGWRDRHPDVIVSNYYGHAETALGGIDFKIKADSDLPAGAMPACRPIWNTRVFVLDKCMNLAPIGVPGELFIAGAVVARGYAGKSHLTAEKFVADPFAADGSRMYRTGDLARWRSDGQVEYLGRADEQVKPWGLGVDLSRVEAALAAHPRVRLALATVADDDVTPQLAAYLVPADSADGIPDASEVREHLRRYLPQPMIPVAVTELAAFPLSQNGRVDRAALPAPLTRPELASAFAAPSTPAEELLAGIWARLLGVTGIGIHDNFFELGGHSLLATQVISRVREVFGADLALSALFNQPTVAGMAEVIKSTAAGVETLPMTRVSRDRWLPLSFAQQRLWFLDQLEPGSVEYNDPMPIRIGGELDVAALGAALSGLIARHEVLRTRLVAGPGGAPCQLIDPPAAFPLPIADVSEAPDPLVMADKLLAADMKEPFDLAAGPLIRGCLIRLGADEHVLALSTHHAVFDEWSRGVLEHELGVLYEALSAGERDPLPPLPVQYADFAVWQREWLSGPVLEGQLAYWREQLAGSPALELPADRPRPPVRSAAGAFTAFAVPAPAVAALRGVAREAGATMFMTVHAVLAVLLGRYCGTEDVVVGTPIANRTRAETEGLIGFFVNTLVLRTDLSGDPSFTTLLARARRTALDAYAHQDLPFEQLVDELVTERDRSRTPLFQVLMNYSESDPGHGDADARGREGDSHLDLMAGMPAKFDLRLMAIGGSDGVECAFQYCTALFDAGRMERMAGHLLRLVEAFAAGPGVPVSRVSMLSAAEREQLASWNATGAAGLPAGGVHLLVAGAAGQFPDAVAVSAPEGSVTYAGLAERAGRLAAVLSAAGAPGDRGRAVPAARPGHDYRAGGGVVVRGGVPAA